jgi:creatinine amidohydrolase
MHLDELSMNEFERKVKEKDLVVILPIGAVEAHGAHLPLNTDSIQPEYVAEELAKRLNVLIAPPIRYGVCTSTRNYPGTISITSESLRSIVRDILLELVRNRVRNIVIIAGHAGMLHMAAIRLAAQDVIDKHDIRLMFLSDYDIAYERLGKEVPESDGHAGTIETSRVMAIRPELYKQKGRKGVNRMPRFRVLRNPENYWNVTTGDPGKASAALGRKMNEYIINGLEKHVREMIR